MDEFIMIALRGVRPGDKVRLRRKGSTFTWVATIQRVTRIRAYYNACAFIDKATGRIRNAKHPTVLLEVVRDR